MRLDHYLVNQKLVKSRSEGQDLIKQGLVLVNKKIIKKTGFDLGEKDLVEITSPRLFVSRSGEKLKDAIDFFKIELQDKIVVDVGSSTGGFTDCALSYGAKIVYAYDVGTNQMNQILRQDSRVILNEQTNILDVEIPKNDLIVIDVSFTSVKPILKHVANQIEQAVILLKPQFETEGKNLKNGVLKSNKVVDQIIAEFVSFIKELDLQTLGFKPSRMRGKEGNLEYLFYLSRRVML